MLPRKGDQVFQLTLTELAFMLIFLMMLVLGWLVLDAYRRIGDNAAELAQARRALAVAADEKAARQKAAAADPALQHLRAAMKRGGYGPEQAMADLRRCAALEPENTQLKSRLAPLEAQIGILDPFVNAMLSLTGKTDPRAAADELTTAMAFRKGFEQAGGRPIANAEAPRLGANCVAAFAQSEAALADRQNLVNQIQFMRHQLESYGDKKGFGPPPCWVDNAGHVQRLIAVDVTEQGLVVQAGWPAERAEDARKLPGIATLLGGGKPQSPAAFRSAAAKILEWGRTRNPECRHYAAVTVSATRADTSVAGQNAVFGYFFPYGNVTLNKGGR